MAKFRKKPVVIEAWRNVLEDAMPEWVKGAIFEVHDGALIIPTLEGDMRADIGDWVIRGVKGEVYPCKPDIFAATYEPLPENHPGAKP